MDERQKEKLRLEEEAAGKREAENPRVWWTLTAATSHVQEQFR